MTARPGVRARFRPRLERLESRLVFSRPTGALLDFPLSQAPADGAGAIVEATNHTTGTLKFSAARGVPAVVPGPRPFTGNAWDFGGTGPTRPNAYVSVASGANTTQVLGDPSRTAGLTVAFWVNKAYQAADANSYLIALGPSFHVNAVQFGAVPQVGFNYGGGGPTIRTPATGPGVLDGNWHHVVASFDFTRTANNLNLYVDGAAAGTASATVAASFASTSALTIGANTLGGQYWYGKLGEVLLFTRGITAAEANALYTQGYNQAFNNPPEVTASAAQSTVSVVQGASLLGTALDDGLPRSPGTVTPRWTKTSGPGTVAFANAGSLNTTARFGSPGTYVLRLTANDGDAAGYAETSVTVLDHYTPVVGVRADRVAVVLPNNSVPVRGTVTADGSAAPAGFTFAWVQSAGPDTVTFDNPLAANTTARFPATPGTYMLRMYANDGGVAVGFADLTEEVYTPGTGGGNLVVQAGTALEAWMFNPTVDLRAGYWDTASSVNFAWSVAVGPAPVTFQNSHTPVTTAKFSAPGTYVLRLDVATVDGTRSGSGTLTVQVYPSGQNFGYTPDVLERSFRSDLGVNYDFQGFDFGRFKAPPAAGTHPRVLFNPEDLPDIRNRLGSTRDGQVLLGQVRTDLTRYLTGPMATYRAAYDGLAAGSLTAFDAVTDKNQVVGRLTFEAFRALLDNDAAGGAKVGAALATVAGEVTAAIRAVMPTVDYQNQIQGLVYRQFLGYAYDFAYNFMTAAQQSAVRQALALATSGMFVVGMDALPALESNTSNWVPTHNMQILMDAAAIEGEPGSDPTLIPRASAALQRYFTFGVASDGTPYEGQGKGSIVAEALVALAKRGDATLASFNAQNHVRLYYNASLLPGGYAFTWDEQNGGDFSSSFNGSKYVDVPTLKYAFPTDPAIDFVFRNDVGDNYTRLNRINFNFPYSSMDYINRMVFALDYDASQTWSQQLQGLNAFLPKTFVSNHRGLTITRTSWDDNAARLWFQPRSELGGHAVPDRTAFTFNALGRIWVPYPFYSQFGGADFENQVESVVRIDGTGPSRLPAALADFADGDLSTFTAGDATVPYAKKPGGTAPADGFTYNSRFFDPLESNWPWADLPYSELPGQLTQQRSGTTWSDNLPVPYAYRTAGLVRGSSPYSLIVDDIYADGNPHVFDWRMTVANDLQTYRDPSAPNDLILIDPASSRRLLVRLIDAAGAPAFSLQTFHDPLRGATQNVLDITTTAVSPNFKVLLMPYTDGTALPYTSFDGTNLYVAAADGQTDQITFAPGDDGRNRVVVQRLGPTPAPAPPPGGGAFIYISGPARPKGYRGAEGYSPEFED